MLNNCSDKEWEKKLTSVPDLKETVVKYHPKEDKERQLLLMEFLLHGLAEFSQISKKPLETKIVFKDLMSSMFNMKESGEE